MSSAECCSGKDRFTNHQMAPTGGAAVAAACTSINAAGSSSSGGDTSGPLNVNEEYRRAVRTKSYTDIWAKVHRHRTHNHHHAAHDDDQHHAQRIARSQSTPADAQGFYIQQYHRDGSNERSIKAGRSGRYSASTASSTAGSSPFSFSACATQRHRSFSCTDDTDDDDEGLHHLQDYLDPADEDRLLDSSSSQAAAPMSRAVHSLFHEYFAVSVEACNVCARLLASVHRARRDQRAFLNALHAARDDQRTHNGQAEEDLAAFADRDNPLSRLRLVHFRRIHDLYASLIRRLDASHRRVTRKARILRGIRRASGTVLVVTCAAVTVAVLAVLSHGILATPAVAAAPVLLNVGRLRSRRRNRTRSKPFPCSSTSSPLLHPSLLLRLGDQLDAAAKGAYIMSRDFETMSRMVARLHDEIEHGKDVVRIFLRSGGERYVLREVVRELDGNETAFADQLDELEEHVFWCLKTINGTRRLVAQKLRGDDGGNDAGDGQSPRRLTDGRTPRIRRASDAVRRTNL